MLLPGDCAPLRPMTWLGDCAPPGTLNLVEPPSEGTGVCTADDGKFVELSECLGDGTSCDGLGDTFTETCAGFPARDSGGPGIDCTEPDSASGWLPSDGFFENPRPQEPVLLQRGQ